MAWRFAACVAVLAMGCAVEPRGAPPWASTGGAGGAPGPSPPGASGAGGAAGRADLEEDGGGLAPDAGAPSPDAGPDAPVEAAAPSACAPFGGASPTIHARGLSAPDVLVVAQDTLWVVEQVHYMHMSGGCYACPECCGGTVRWVSEGRVAAETMPVTALSHAADAMVPSAHGALVLRGSTIGLHQPGGLVTELPAPSTSTSPLLEHGGYVWWGAADTECGPNPFYNPSFPILGGPTTCWQTNLRVARREASAWMGGGAEAEDHRVPLSSTALLAAQGDWLFIVENHRVAAYTVAGALLREWSFPGGVTAVAGSSGGVYLVTSPSAGATTHEVLRFDAATAQPTAVYSGRPLGDVAAAGDWLYFSRRADPCYEIGRLPVIGGPEEILWREGRPLSGITLHGDRVYWLRADTSGGLVCGNVPFECSSERDGEVVSLRVVDERP